MTTDELLRKLEQVKPIGNRKWMALCPAHNDHTPSLKITDDCGTTLLYCHAGCKYDEVCAALGLDVKDLFPDNRNQRTGGNQETFNGAAIVEKYDYCDEKGQLLYRICRTTAKEFPVQKPDGGWGFKGSRRVLYRLPDLLKSTDTVYLPEGEKDADRLSSIGLTSTTNPGGSNGWRKEYAELLRGRDVVILPDNDSAGKKHCKAVGISLEGVATSVRVVEPPGLPEGSDVSDWLNNGGNVEVLRGLVRSALSGQEWVKQQQSLPQQPEPAVTPTENDDGYHLSDSGNAERLAKLYGDRLRYNRTSGHWLYFDGKRWDAQTGEEKARNLALKTVRVITDEASGKKPELRKKICKWSLSSESNAKLKAMLEAAEAVSPFACYANQFDKDILLLNVQNGTLDLRTGELQDHNPADMITKLAPVVYDAEAEHDTWSKLLNDATDNDTVMQEFLQTAIGYSLTGSTDEETLFFIHGPGASGKSTFIEAVKATLGDYAQTSDFETFLQRRQVGAVRNDIARLDGCRLVSSIEVDEGKKLAEGLVKMLTGGDKVTARFLYRESFEFTPQCKLWLVANHAPRVKDDDDAMWRRILKVPFEHVVPKGKREPTVKAILRDPEQAGPAVLAWAVKGCLRWQAEGLIVPDIVKKATEEYRSNEDPLRDFFDDVCKFDKNAFIPVAKLRGAYKEWAEENGVKYTLGRRNFNHRLETLGCERRQKRYYNEHGTEKNEKCWMGITLESCPQTDQETEPDDGSEEKFDESMETDDDIPF